MKKIILSLFCAAAGLTVANPTWAHSGGGEGHGASFGLSHGDADGTVSTHGTRSAAAGHRGASHHGHALSARNRSSHLTATHHVRAHHLTHALAQNRFARFSTAHQVTITPDVDTPAEKALPPGIELNVDRGELPAPKTVEPDEDGE